MNQPNLMAFKIVVTVAMISSLANAQGQSSKSAVPSRPQMTNSQLQSENRQLRQISNKLPTFEFRVAQQRAEIKLLRQQNALLQRALMQSRQTKVASQHR